MPSEFDKLVEEKKKTISDQIDDYRDTVYAILGFCSLWFYDPIQRNNRNDVTIFQGRYLSPITEPIVGNKNQAVVCPDFGIVIGEQRGILGEVKKNFPREENDRRQRIYLQLKSYDQELLGWPTTSGELPSHELVLLTHQATARQAQAFFRENAEKGLIRFVRPFSIFEFNRVDQREFYFFFRIVEGDLRQTDNGKNLFNGVPVPMQALFKQYSESMLYDAEPPLAYLLVVIWQYVLTPVAAENPKFGRLRSSQKLEIDITVDEMVQQLDIGFSFHRWHTEHNERQRQVPRIEWVQKACQFLVETKEASWVTENVELKVFFCKRKDVLAHFIELQASLEANKTMRPMLLDSK